MTDARLESFMEETSLNALIRITATEIRVSYYDINNIDATLVHRYIVDDKGVEEFHKDVRVTLVDRVDSEGLIFIFDSQGGKLSFTLSRENESYLSCTFIDEDGALDKNFGEPEVWLAETVMRDFLEQKFLLKHPLSSK